MPSRIYWSSPHPNYNLDVGVNTVYKLGMSNTAALLQLLEHDIDAEGIL